MMEEDLEEEMYGDNGWGIFFSTGTVFDDEKRVDKYLYTVTLMFLTICVLAITYVKTRPKQTPLAFGREFTEAVEAKLIAQQEAERARYVVEKAELQKKAAIISAERDSKAAELLAHAFGKEGEGLVELKKIEAAEDIDL